MASGRERKKVTIKVPPAVARFSGVDPSVRMVTPVWVYWCEIAQEQTQLAVRAARSNDPHGELLASMVAIAAAAHALDGLYGSLKPMVGSAPSDAARHRQVLELLKHGFAIGKKSHEWADEFEWLFELRDWAVHHGESDLEPVRHPTLPTNVAPESAAYSATSAERAFELLRDVLRTCLRNPKPATREWAEVRLVHVENVLGQL